MATQAKEVGNGADGVKDRSRNISMRRGKGWILGRCMEAHP